jgi:hypothetical protein
MSNEFYNHAGWPAQGANGDSASARSELDNIAAAFNKMPGVAGNALKLIRVNAAASGLESVSVAAALGANLDLQTLNSGQLSGFRNKIINGDMMVSQVNGTTAVTPAATSYPLDQWQNGSTGASKLTFQQVADAPAGFKYSTKISVAVQTAAGSTDQYMIRQPIEGQNIIDLQFGVATAVSVAVSLWIKGSVAGTYSISLNNAAGTRSYIGTIAVTNSWVKQTFVLTGCTDGVWATDNTNGMFVTIDLGSGSSFVGTAGSWLTNYYMRASGSVAFVNQVNGSTLNITGVQLEQVSAGATQGTAFEHVPYETQLRWCQRYLPAIPAGSMAIGLCISTSSGWYSFPLGVSTRIPVTGIVVSGAAPTIYNYTGASGLASNGTTFQSASTQTLGIDPSTVVGTPTLLINTAAMCITGSSIFGIGAQL